MIKTKITIKSCCLFILISTLAEVKPINNYDFPIAGNRSIEECILGERPKIWNEDMYMTTSELARILGFSAEEHVVVTEDGYILTLHRIPGPPGAQPVFLQPGLFGSSFNFVMIGKDKALAFILVENGYDVWIGNHRGSTYSTCHTHYKTSEYKYWNFSWHEMGLFDLPAQISYVTNVTKQDIIYVGHSMGTTMSYVMAIERPDIAAKIKALFSFAPVAYFYQVKDPIKYIAPFVRIFEGLSKLIGGKIPAPPKNAIKYLCTLTMIQKKICVTFSFIFFGFHYQSYNYTVFPTLAYHVSDISLKTLNHYFHESNSGRFSQYDYGRKGNIRMYNNPEAPDYDISKINVPVGIFWSINDYISSEKDVQRFYQQLPNKILNYKIENPKFNHLDYILGSDSKVVYTKLLSVMENYR